MAIALLAAGLFLLAIAGEALVRGAIAAARRLRMPPLVIGLTIVAFGTSAPEMIVSIEAALNGAPGLSVGNAIGSNITNVLLVLGLPAMLGPVLLTEQGVRRSTLFMLAVSIVLTVLIQDHELSRLEGLGFITLLALYIGYNLFTARSGRAVAKPHLPHLAPEVARAGWLQLLALLLFGMVGLAYGGKLTTDGALGIAELFGLGHAAVGLTIVALGTSLPELAASVAAARRGQASVAIGNVVGSNIFNILAILGITATITPLRIDQAILSHDIWIMLGSSALLLPLVFWRRRIDRLAGAGLVLLYLVFVVVAVRGGMPS